MDNYSNYSAVCEDYESSTPKYVSDIFVTVSAPVTIIFNCLVLTVALKYVKFKRRLEQYFVVNIAMSDLLLGLIYIFTLRNAEKLPWFLCRSYYACLWITTMGSVMFLLLLNIHKFATLMFPIKALVFMTRNKVLLQIFLCWLTIFIISGIFASEPFLRMKYHHCYECYVDMDPNVYSVRLLLLYILPLTLSLIISICIFIVAQKNSRRSKKWFKRILFVFSSTIWTASTSLPYRVSYLVTKLCIAILHKSLITETSNQSLNSTSLTTAVYSSTSFAYYTNSTTADDETAGSYVSCFEETVQYTLLCWLMLGSVINPLITIFTQNNYRNGVRKLWSLVTRAKTYMSPHSKSSGTSLTTTYQNE